MRTGEQRSKKNELRSRKSSILLSIIIFSFLSLIIQSSQIYTKGFVLGVDSIFHMNRIYDAMMQLKTGELSYFISIFGYDQSARIVNAAYGPFVAYLLGGILLISGSWVKFQLITSFLINVIGALGVFRIAKKIHLSDLIGIACGALFMSTYFLASWNYAGSFTSVGAAVIPWVLYYGIEMVNDKDRDFSVLGLGISMGILLQTHIFSSLLVTLALVPFVVYALITHRKKSIFVTKILFSILIAVLISLNVFIGLFQLMSSNNLIQTAPRNLYESMINLSSITNNSQVNIGLIFSLLYLGQIIAIILHWKETELLVKIMTVTGGVFLFLSSSWFPWQLVGDLLPSLQSTIQFPSRFQVIPAVLLLIASGKMITKWESRFGILALCVLSVISITVAQNRISERMTTWSSDNVLASPNKLPSEVTPEKMREVLTSQNLNEIFSLIHKGTPDYLPTQKPLDNDEYENADLYTLYWDSIINPGKFFDKEVKNGKLIVKWESELDENRAVPIIKYANTIVRKDGKEISPDTNNLGAVIIPSSKGSNMIEVSYQAPLYVTISIFIAIVSLISFCLIWVIRSLII